MRYFLDTNVIIEILNQNEKAIQKLREIYNEFEKWKKGEEVSILKL